MEYLFAVEFEFILTILLQIFNRTKFFQYRSMSGGRFLVSLTEVCTSEKTWYADPCSKWETIITGYTQRKVLLIQQNIVIPTKKFV